MNTFIIDNLASLMMSGVIILALLGAWSHTLRSSTEFHSGRRHGGTVGEEMQERKVQ